METEELEEQIILKLNPSKTKFVALIFLIPVSYLMIIFLRSLIVIGSGVFVNYLAIEILIPLFVITSILFRIVFRRREIEYILKPDGIEVRKSTNLYGDFIDKSSMWSYNIHFQIMGSKKIVYLINLNGKTIDGRYFPNQLEIILSKYASKKGVGDLSEKLYQYFENIYEISINREIQEEMLKKLNLV